MPKLCPLTKIMPSEYERDEYAECDKEDCAWWMQYSPSYTKLTGKESCCAIIHVARSSESRE